MENAAENNEVQDNVVNRNIPAEYKDNDNDDMETMRSQRCAPGVSKSNTDTVASDDVDDATISLVANDSDLNREDFHNSNDDGADEGIEDKEVLHEGNSDSEIEV